MLQSHPWPPQHGTRVATSSAGCTPPLAASITGPTSVCEVLHTSQAEVTQPHPCASWPIPARQWVATRRRCRGAAQDRLARNKNDFLALLRLQRQLVRAPRPLAFDDGPRNDSRMVCSPFAT